MASVLFDFTRLTSAFGQVPDKPHLFLIDLARLVEAIILYDAVITTVPTDVFRPELTNRSPFDFRKKHIYESLFDHVIQDIPEHSRAITRRDKNRQHAEGPPLIPASTASGDLATLQALRDLVSTNDFMFDFNSQLTQDRLLASIGRVRTLLSLSRLHGIPYEPIPFRIPIAEHLCPPNLPMNGLSRYRDFEQKVYGYIREVSGADSLQLRMPMLFNIAVKHSTAGEPDSLFEVALQMRGDPLFERLRKLMHEFTNAAGMQDFKLMARVKRQFEAEIKRLADAWSGTTTATILEVKFKPDWPPIEASFDIGRWMQNRKDSDVRPPIANLSRLTERTFLELDPGLKRVERLLGIRVDSAELARVTRVTISVL